MTQMVHLKVLTMMGRDFSMQFELEWDQEVCEKSPRSSLSSSSSSEGNFTWEDEQNDDEGKTFFNPVETF